MAGLAERLRTEGIQQGMQQGMQQGRQHEAQNMLRKLLMLKFGELPSWADTQIETASIEQLETWMEGILSTDTLEALIEPTQ